MLTCLPQDSPSPKFLSASSAPGQHKPLHPKEASDSLGGAEQRGMALS